MTRQELFITPALVDIQALRRNSFFAREAVSQLIECWFSELIKSRCCCSLLSYLRWLVKETGLDDINGINALSVQEFKKVLPLLFGHYKSGIIVIQNLCSYS